MYLPCRQLFVAVCADCCRLLGAGALVVNGFLPFQALAYELSDLEALVALSDYSAVESALDNVLGGSERARTELMLGVLAERQGDYDQARYWYAKVANQNRDLDLQAQADDAIIFLDFIALERTNSESQDQASGGIPDFLQKDRYLAISIEQNYSDGLTTTRDDATADVTDSSTIYSLDGLYDIFRGDRVFYGASISIVDERYADFSTYDFTLLSPGIYLGFDAPRHLLRLSVDQSRYWLDSKTDSDETELGFEAELVISPEQSTWRKAATIEILYRNSTAKDDVSLPYEGEEKSLRVGMEIAGRVNADIALIYEQADRTEGYFSTGLVYTRRNGAGNFVLGVPMINHSRDVLGYSLRIDWDYSRRFRQSLFLLKEKIDYDLPVRIVEQELASPLPPTTAFFLDREDDRHSIFVSLEFLASRHWSFYLNAVHTENKSSINGSSELIYKPFDFSTQTYGFGAQYSF